MSHLNATQHSELDDQRFDAPVRRALREALSALGASEKVQAVLDVATVESFDVQTRAAFSLSKLLGMSSAQAGVTLSNELGARLTGIATCEASAGLAFVNIRFDDAWLVARLRTLGSIFPHAPELRFLIDYSSPNCAKRMHVGHLRSTVIGDALARMLEACGSDVERVNHLGDWGTPFGIIIEQAKEEGAEISSLDLASTEGIYQRGAARFALGATLDHDGSTASLLAFQDGSAFAQRARATTASMQRREEPAFGAWKAIRASTVRELQSTYDLLGIGLRPEHAIGESFYQDLIAPALLELGAKGITTSSDKGVAFLGGKVPLALEKSATNGGGYLYGGTDAAALKMRALTGRFLLYVTDDRQADHFQALFDMGLQAGWTFPGQAIHVPFGMMLDASGQPFKSRSGAALPLSELVGQALDAARAAISERVPHATPEEIESFARPIGLGALKYGDLSRSRTSSVKFDIEQAARLDGDTAPYLQYARVRAASAALAAAHLPRIERSSDLHPAERHLILAMARMRDAAIEAVETLEPHRLAHAMGKAAGSFGSFYEHCPCVFDGTCDPLRLELMERFSSFMAEALESLGVKALDSMPRASARVAPTPR